LDECRLSYEKLRTLHAEGVLRDYREGQARIQPLSWDFVRPDRCRLQIGDDLALIVGDTWWSYAGGQDRFQKHRRFTSTPIETAAHLLSDGVPFLLPGLLTRPGTVLGVGARRSRDWKLMGVDWSGGRPCYVIARPVGLRGGNGTMRAWLDQDSHLIRAWDLVVPRADGGERVVLACAYHRLEVDGPISNGRLALAPPQPIPLPTDLQPLEAATSASR